MEEMGSEGSWRGLALVLKEVQEVLQEAGLILGDPSAGGARILGHPEK